MDETERSKLWRATEVAATRPTSGHGELVGREAELDRLTAFLGDRSGRPNGLVIEGPAGAGKTTLWRAAVDRASANGDLVISARAAGAEVNLSLSVLGDLLEDHLSDLLPALPAPQRRALEVALLLEDDGGHPPDQRAVSAGALTAIRTLARDRPVVIAIDDAQWVDPQSTEILAFVLRRLRDLPVAVVVTWRTPSAAAPATSPALGLRLERAMERAPDRLAVGPLSFGALHHILRSRTGLELNRRAIQRIHEASGGNPFYALELAGSIARDATASRDEPLTFGGGLGELLQGRLGGLDEPTREALFVAAAAAQPTVELLDDLIGPGARAALEPAIGAGIIRVGDDGHDPGAGTIEFGHPLLAAAAYALPAAGVRRRWHERLANAATDPEARARHLALARAGPDREVADALREAARVARARGALASAAELFGSAIDRLAGGDAGEARAAWAVEAAPLLRATGNGDRARAILEASLGDLEPGPLRSDVLVQLAATVRVDAGGAERELELLEQAIAEAGDDPRRQAAALLDREMHEREKDQLAAALPIAQRALALAEASGDDWLLTQAHIRTADLEVLLGYEGDPVERFGQALELDARVAVEAENGASTMLSACLIRKGRLADARVRLEEQLRRSVAEGDEASRVLLSVMLTELEWLAGRWDAAAGHAREGLEIAEQGSAPRLRGAMLVLLGLVEASRGDPERARELAIAGRAMCEAIGEVAYARYGSQVLGFLDQSLGQAVAAHANLDTYSVETGIEGTKRITFVGDDIEALVASGELDRAETLADEVGRRAQTLHRPMLAAIGARGRALVLGARGRLDVALEEASNAVQAFAELEMPFERARALLVLGEIQRRAKQRRSARETLTEAISVFDALGAHRWSERASAERARIGGRTAVGGLTETELRVARLVAEGKSNKEIAAELYVTVRAVEANLSKIYAKLGIRSRMELSRHL